MTLARFVRKNALRNKRRSLLTVLSIAFPLLLLSFLMSVWRVFYIDQGAARSAQRLFVRHKIFLASFIPIHYADKIRTVPGVLHVVPMNWFGGIYKDRKPENFFSQFGTYPDEFFETFTELSIPADQEQSWKHDRAGSVADIKLAKKYGWKIGDRIVVQGDAYPVKLELTLRGLFTSELPNDSLYFNWKYVEEGLSWAKGPFRPVGFTRTCQRRLCGH
jgi:putative ABC transport system permease protein